MIAPDRMRALLKEPGLIVMPAVWDGLTAKLAAGAGLQTSFLSGSCVAASRLGGPDLDLVSFGEMFDSFNMVRAAAPDTLVLADGDHGHGNAMSRHSLNDHARAREHDMDCTMAPGGIRHHSRGVWCTCVAVPLKGG